MRSLILLLCGFLLGLATTVYAKSWPSVGGTTAQGVVIENGVNGSKSSTCL